MLLRSGACDRLHPRRLVHAGRLADLGRRPALHSRHRRHDRAPEIHRHRRAAGRRSSLPRRPQGRPPHRLLRHEDHLWRAAARRRAQPHRNGDAASTLLPAPWSLRLKAQAQATRIAGSAARREAPHDPAPQGRRGRRRRRRQPHRGLSASCPTSIRSRRSATSTLSRRRKSPAEHGIATVVTDFDDLLAPRSRHRRHLHALGAALRAGAQGAARRPPRRGGKAVRQLARRGRRARRAGAASPASGSRPIFQYRFADGIAQLLHLRAEGFVGKAYVGDGGDALAAACRPITTIPGAAAGRPSSAAAWSRTPSTTTTC